jgi:hypothetical protein
MSDRRFLEERDAMPGKTIDDERRACDAVARVLEERSAAARTNAHSPEDDGIGPPVEYVFELAGRTPDGHEAYKHSAMSAESSLMSSQASDYGYSQADRT